MNKRRKELFFELTIEAGNLKDSEQQIHDQKIKRQYPGMIPVNQKKDDEEAQIGKQLDSGNAHEFVNKVFSFSGGRTEQILMQQGCTETKEGEDIPGNRIMPGRFCKVIPAKKPCGTKEDEHGKFNKKLFHCSDG